MKIKTGVNFFRPHKVLLVVCGFLDDLHMQLTKEEMVVTSGRRIPGSLRSLHGVSATEEFRAIDVRRWSLDAMPWYEGNDNVTSTAEFLRLARLSWWVKRYGVQFVLEPEELTSLQITQRGGHIDPHIHVEVDPDDDARLEWERIA